MNVGKLYIGYYENDKKEGFGIYYWSSPNMRVCIGFRKNGKQHGERKYINPQELESGKGNKNLKKKH